MGERGLIAGLFLILIYIFGFFMINMFISLRHYPRSYADVNLCAYLLFTPLLFVFSLVFIFYLFKKRCDKWGRRC